MPYNSCLRRIYTKRLLCHSRRTLLNTNIFSANDALCMVTNISTSKLAVTIVSIILSTTLLTNSLHETNASQSSDFMTSQSLKQYSLCAEHSECSNLGFNTAELIKNLKQKIFSRVNQHLKQHNLCVDSECINEGYNQFTIDKLKGKFSGKFNQKIEQSNECENSKCINEGVNEINGNSNTNSQQTIIQSNQCASGATCINSGGSVYLIGNPTRIG